MSSNVAVVCGEVVSAPVFSHDIKGENFYEFLVRSPRKTEGVSDDIVISVSDRMCDIDAVQEGVLVRVSGRYSSRNVRDEKIGRNRLKLTILLVIVLRLQVLFARSLHIVTHLLVGRLVMY